MKRITLMLVTVLVFALFAEPAFASRKVIALTFDDGPSRNNPKVVEILRSHDASATFFFVGKRMTKGAFDPTSLLEVGEVGNHTWKHSNSHPWKKLSYAAAKKEIRDTNTRIFGRTGQKCVWFRSVGLQKSKASDRAIKSAGMRNVGGVLVEDWGRRSGNKSSAIKKRVIRKASKSGSILILHETNKETIKALPGILDWYHDHGYKVVTVSQLKNRK